MTYYRHWRLALSRRRFESVLLGLSLLCLTWERADSSEDVLGWAAGYAGAGARRQVLARPERRLMLASHGRSMWYYLDTGISRLLHSGEVGAVRSGPV
jgi:hypothetical protein